MPTTRILPSGLMHLLQSQFKAKAIKIVSLLIVLWLAYQMMQLIISKSGVQVGEQFKPVPITTLTNHTSQVTVKKVNGIHLSGAPPTDQEPLEPAPIVALVTRIKMVLQGTFASDNPQLAHAIIADASGKEKIYTVGDYTPDGGKLHEILIDRVILVRNQRYETLLLFHDDVKSVITNPELASTHKNDHQSDSLGLSTMKELPVSLNELVSPQPVYVSGKFIGIQINPTKDPHLMGKLGLQQGDVITWINGADLDNSIKAMQALQSISSGDYVNMTVTRNGLDTSLSFYMP